MGRLIMVLYFLLCWRRNIWVWKRNIWSALTLKCSTVHDDRRWKMRDPVTQSGSGFRFHAEKERKSVTLEHWKELLSSEDSCCPQRTVDKQGGKCSPRLHQYDTKTEKSENPYPRQKKKKKKKRCTDTKICINIGPYSTLWNFTNTTVVVTFYGIWGQCGESGCSKVKKMSVVWKYCKINDDDNSKADWSYEEEKQRQLPLILVTW